MTRTSNARIAGFTLLVYIAAGVAGMVLFAGATGGSGIEARLASLADHATEVRVTVLLALLQAFSAFVLAVTLYALTREQDRDLAMLGLACRVAEGITGAFVARTLGLLWLATAGGNAGTGMAGNQALAAFLFRMGAFNPGAIFFAAGSTLFCWLFLRGRIIPAALAWLGLLASVLLVVVLPLDLSGLLARPAGFLVWLPMLVFELVLALWLVVKGAAVPAAAPSA